MEIPCLRCGTCCAKYQPRLGLAEAHLIADTLGISWQHFVEKFIDERWPGTQSLLIRHNDGFCAFFKTSASVGLLPRADCLIHAFKPACCREWKTGLDRPECQQGLKKLWSLTVDSSGCLCGTPAKKEAFKRYIDSQKRQ